MSLACGSVLWHVFRLGYYRDIFPNTYYAKSGGSYWSQGAAYIADFAAYAPLSAAGVILVAGLAFYDFRRRTGPERWRRPACLLAILLHIAVIARVGGDFMGFRLLLPDLAAAAALSAGALAGLGPRTRPVAQVGLAAAAMWALFLQPTPPHERGLIVNERLNFASAYTRASDAFTGRPRHLWWNEGRLFRAFQECVGEPDLIVEYPNIGYYGVALGTRTSLIDGNGLVDRFVARNWEARKGLPRGRPGHEGKMTVDYALKRKIHFVRDMFEPYRSTMSTDYGILLSFDPRIVCALPGKAEALRGAQAAARSSRRDAKVPRHPSVPRGSGKTRRRANRQRVSRDRYAPRLQPGRHPAGQPVRARLDVLLDRRAEADEVAVAVGVVDPRHVRPELLLAGPRRRERRLFAGVGVRPGVGGDHARGVRRVLERVVLRVDLPLDDPGDLGPDPDHRLAETVEFGERFALRRLDHQGAGNREGHGGRVEAVVHQPLRHVLGLDARAP